MTTMMTVHHALVRTGTSSESDEVVRERSFERHGVTAFLPPSDALVWLRFFALIASLYCVMLHLAIGLSNKNGLGWLPDRAGGYGLSSNGPACLRFLRWRYKTMQVTYGICIIDSLEKES